MTVFSLPALGTAGALYQTRENLQDAVRAADAHLQDQIDALVNGSRPVGQWSAASGAFPTLRPSGDAIQPGDWWEVTTGGTVDSVAFAQFDRLLAVGTGGATYAGNWIKIKYSDAITTVTADGGTVARPLINKLGDVITSVDRGLSSSTDSSAALEAMLLYCANNNKTAVLRGRIRLDSFNIDIPNNCIIRGENCILDFANADVSSGFDAANGALVRCLGAISSNIGAPTLTVEALPGARIITVPGHGRSVGDWIRIQSTINANAASAGEWRLGDRNDFVMLSETAEIVGVSGDVLTLRDGLTFPYPAGTFVRSIAHRVLDIEGVTIDAANIGGAVEIDQNRPFLAEFCHVKRFDVEVLNARGAVTFGTALPGSSARVRSLAAPTAYASAENVQLVRVLDTSTIRLDVDLRGGGQALDITYRPSGTARGPNVGVEVTGEVDGALLAALTDHPTNFGTTYRDLRIRGSRWGIYSRSRNVRISNVDISSLGSETSDTIGVVLGESGFTQGFRASNLSVTNAETGVLLGGGDGALKRRDWYLNGYHAEFCKTGLQISAGSTDNDNALGIVVRGYSCANITDEALYISGNADGLDVEMTARGPFANGAVSLYSGELRRARIVGKVIDGGSTRPVILQHPDSGGASLGRGCWIALDREGVNAAPTVPVAHVGRPVRVVGTFYSAGASTQSTTAATLVADMGYTPAGVFALGSQLRFRASGTVSGTADTKQLRLIAGSDLLLSVVIPATVTNRWEVEGTISFLDSGGQFTESRVFGDGMAEPVLSSVARSLSMAAQQSYSIAGLVTNAADTLTLRSATLEAFFV